MIRALLLGTLICASQRASATALTKPEPDPGLDPTVLHSRVKLTNEFVAQDFGASTDTTQLNLSYAFGKGARNDWTVQLDLPLVAYRAGDAGGVPDATGLGDIETRIGHVFDAEGVFRWGLGVEAQFDTATQPQLGSGIFRLSPGAVLAVQPWRAFSFQATTQFNQSLAEDAGVSELQQIETKPAIQVSLPAEFYAYAENSLKWDLQAGGMFSSKLKFEIGRGFGARSEWVLSARYEVPLTESADQHTFKVGCSYVFP